MKNVVVIGGGIIGLCSAYYLAKEGHKVTVVDQSAMRAGASYVNAGYVSPSHIMPLAAPGVVKQGVKWMFDQSSPLYIKPKLQKEFLSWAWAFNKSCSKKNVATSVSAIKDIALLSRELYSEIRASEGFQFQLENKGLLMLCRSQQALEKELEIAAIASAEGLEVSEVTPAALQQMEPNVAVSVVGATHYMCDWHSTPNEFMEEMKAQLIKMGVSIHSEEKVIDFKTSEAKIIAVITNTQEIVADEFVLAAGSWTAQLSKRFGIKIKLAAGKGYRINSSRDLGIQIPAILAERKVAVTPMNGFTRFAGTMEINGINHTINRRRVEAIANAVQSYYPSVNIMETEKAEAACGLRPVSPDGRPYIGKSAKCKNLTIASGHAMMGWSMGPATGKLVSEIISEKKTTMDTTAFHVDRKF